MEQTWNAHWSEEYNKKFQNLISYQPITHPFFLRESNFQNGKSFFIKETLLKT